MLSSKFGVVPNWAQATSIVPSTAAAPSSKSFSSISMFDSVVFIAVSMFDSVVLIVKLSSKVTSVPSANVMTLFSISMAVIFAASRGVSSIIMLEGKREDGKREDVATTSPPETSMNVLTFIPLTSESLFIKTSSSGVSTAVPFPLSPTTVLVPFSINATCPRSNCSAFCLSFSSSLLFFSLMANSFSCRSFSSCASISARSSTEYPRIGRMESYSSPSFNCCLFHGCC
mmetsp:Transcript_37626/g.67768  ORF Transcript_37626/g.67768 Transcript_37626/m.67768 type:complete len:229 (-) Transcript_37626:238-924(-)